MREGEGRGPGEAGVQGAVEGEGKEGREGGGR